MASQNQKAEHLDEIVFKDRNKAYGAYVLRKIYKKHMTIALFISVTTLLISVSIPLIASYMKSKKRIIIEEQTVGAELTNMEKPPDDEPPPPPPPPPEALEQKVAFKAPIVVTDSVEDVTIFVMEDLNLQSTNTTVDTTSFVVENKVINEPVEEAFLVVEEMPTFPGGDEARAQYFKENIKYPEIERDNGVQGLVVVSFIVEKDGSITNVTVLKGVTPNLDAEAIRVVKSMPKWTSGKQSGRAVRVTINVPIRFTLN